MQLLNKKLEQNKNSIDEDLNELGKILETALINAKEWEIQQQRKFQNSKEKGEIYEHLLQCKLNEFLVMNVNYPRPINKNYQINFVSFINSAYKNLNGYLIEYLNNNLNEFENGFYIKELKEKAGFFYKSVIIGGITYQYPMNGLQYFEDDDGFKFIIDFTCDLHQFGSDCGMQLNIFSNGNINTAKEKIQKFLDSFEKYCRSNKVFKHGVFDIDGNEIKIDYVGWNSLKISKDTRNKINFHILDFINKYEEIKKRGLKTSRGIILCGKPGNGKTLLGKIISTNLNLPVIWVTGKDLSFQTILKIGKLFDFANYISPSIIFIEDGDIFLPNRQLNNITNNQVLSEFLNNIDGIKVNKGVITILTANNPELLDEAVKNRPSRFDAYIELGVPEPEQRVEILSDILKDKIRDNEQIFINKISEKLAGCSGAVIKEFAERLIMEMIYENSEYITELNIKRELANLEFKSLNKRKVGIV